jgi:hypothetical protein
MRQFCVWICVGFVAGGCAFATNMQYYWSKIESRVRGISSRNRYALQSSSDRYYAATVVFISVELMCTSFAMNMLLRRVSDHASHSYYNNARDHQDGGRKRFDWRDCIGQYKLFYWVRTMRVITVLLCAMYTVACIVVAAFRAEQSVFYDQAMAACDADGRETNKSRSIYTNGKVSMSNKIYKSDAASAVLEATVMLFMISGFVLFFPACIIMFRRIEQRLNTIINQIDHRPDHGDVLLPFEFSPPTADGHQNQLEMQAGDARRFLGRIKISAANQRKRFISCLFLVLTALSLRATMSVYFCVVLFQPEAAGGTQSSVCGLCDTCQPLARLMILWYANTPELPPLIISLTSTLPLIFSLWLMTTKHDRALLMNPSLFRSESLQPIKSEVSAKISAECARMGVDLQ